MRRSALPVVQDAENHRCESRLIKKVQMQGGESSAGFAGAILGEVHSPSARALRNLAGEVAPRAEGAVEAPSEESLRRRWAFFISLLGVLLFLAACAGPARIPRPADFPFHATDHSFFDLHWRVDRGDGVVLAMGLVEAARVSGVADVTVELQGVNGAGAVVSTARGATYGGALYRGDARAFVVRLRPRGQEERFEPKVWSFTWDTRGDGGPGRR